MKFVRGPQSLISRPKHRALSVIILFPVALLLVAANCDGSEGPGELSTCTAASDCDDNWQCNGREICDPGHAAADMRGCVAGYPCGPYCIDGTCRNCSPRKFDDQMPDCLAAGSSEDECEQQICIAGAPPQCAADSHCDNDNFCDGVERCSPFGDGANESGCVVGESPCATDEVCLESSERCVATGCESSSDRDRDGDGSDRIECGGADCDDDDPLRYPSNTEECRSASDETRDEDCDPSTIGTRDNDGDGFIATVCSNEQADGTLKSGTDCDDADPTVHPAAQELCNGRDDNCNDATDEGTQVMAFADTDLDGFGAGALVGICPGTLGYSPVDTDCNDADARVNPGEYELCNGVDDDCNDIPDDNCIGGGGGAGDGGVSCEPIALYPDLDNDGYGTGAAELVCPGTPYYAPTANDCDDANSNYFPGRLRCRDVSPNEPNDAEYCDDLGNDVIVSCWGAQGGLCSVQPPGNWGVCLTFD